MLLTAGFSGLFLFLQSVIMDFYTEHYCGRYSGDCVCDYKRPVAKHKTLDYKENTTKGEQTECRRGYAVGVAGADCVYSLREIAANHANGCRIAYDIDNYR